MIDNMPIREMLAKSRFAPSVDPLLMGETGEYFSKVMSAKRAAIGGLNWTILSKQIGW
jgi:hypothetical protein